MAHQMTVMMTGVQKDLPTPLRNYFRSSILTFVLFFLFRFS